MIQRTTVADCQLCKAPLAWLFAKRLSRGKIKITECRPLECIATRIKKFLRCQSSAELCDIRLRLLGISPGLVSIDYSFAQKKCRIIKNEGRVKDKEKKRGGGGIFDASQVPYVYLRNKVHEC